MRKIITFKKGDFLKRKMVEATTMRGWVAVEEREVKKFSWGKGILLGILFPPLALLGFGKQIEVTYEKAA